MKSMTWSCAICDECEGMYVCEYCWDIVCENCAVVCKEAFEDKPVKCQDCAYTVRVEFR
jgi:hypothetical protein